MASKKLIIIGAGQFGREVYAWAKQSKEYGSKWTIKGFLDSRPHILNEFHYKTRVIGDPITYKPMPDDLFICALGEPESKKQYSSPILEKGGIFTSIIHPSVVFGEHVRLGSGVILCPYAIVSSDTTIEDYVTINVHSNVAHDVRIGTWSQLSPSVTVNGKVTLEDSVFVGSGATILPNTVVGAGARIGAGSIVMGKVRPGVTVFGSLAKELPFPHAKR